MISICVRLLREPLHSAAVKRKPEICPFQAQLPFKLRTRVSAATSIKWPLLRWVDGVEREARFSASARLCGCAELAALLSVRLNWRRKYNIAFRRHISSTVRMAERSKAPDSSSGPRKWAWVQIPLLTQPFFFWQVFLVFGKVLNTCTLLLEISDRKVLFSLISLFYHWFSMPRLSWGSLVY